MGRCLAAGAAYRATAESAFLPLSARSLTPLARVEASSFPASASACVPAHPSHRRSLARSLARCHRRGAFSRIVPRSREESREASAGGGDRNEEPTAGGAGQSVGQPVALSFLALSALSARLGRSARTRHGTDTIRADTRRFGAAVPATLAASLPSLSRPPALPFLSGRRSIGRRHRPVPEGPTDVSPSSSSRPRQWHSATDGPRAVFSITCVHLRSGSVSGSAQLARLAAPRCRRSRCARATAHLEARPNETRRRCPLDAFGLVPLRNAVRTRFRGRRLRGWQLGRSFREDVEEPSRPEDSRW